MAALLTILCLYDYRDELGRLLYQVIRYKPGHVPRFSQRRPDGLGGWIDNLDGVPRVLYHLQAVIAAAAAGGVVYVVEARRTCTPPSVSGWSPPAAREAPDAGSPSSWSGCVAVARW
jgi:hypothetical protein